LSTNYFGELHKIDLETEEVETRKFLPNSTESEMSSFTADGQWYVYEDKGNFRLCNVAEKEVVRSLFAPDFHFIKWNHEGTHLAIGGFGPVAMWDPFSNKPPRKSKIDSTVSSFAWSPDDDLLAIGCSDGRIRFVTPDSLAGVTEIAGHTGNVTFVDWSPNGRRIASSSNDGTVRIWDAATGDHLLTFEHPQSHPYYSVVWSPDGRRLAAGDSHGTIFIWGSDQMKPLPVTAHGLASGVVAKALTE
jgi:WD40 repeat protein